MNFLRPRFPTLARLLAPLALATLMAACNAGEAEQRAVTAAEPAKPMAAKPVAADPVEEPAPATTVQPAEIPAAVAPAPALPEASAGRACATDSDCVVKDVGSCCGYRPQCLNKATPTFPDEVKAQCAREGRVSTCGVLAISGCSCVAGKCENVLLSDDSLPAAPAPLK